MDDFHIHIQDMCEMIMAYVLNESAFEHRARMSGLRAAKLRFDKD